MTKTSKPTMHDVLSLMMERMDRQDAVISNLIASKSEPAKAKAAAAGPELAISTADGKYAVGLLLNFNGRKSGRFLYPAELEIIFKHKAEIEAAIKKMPK